MVLYPSQEWCDEWKKLINADEAITKTGAKWGVSFNGDWLFVLTPGGGLEETAYVFLAASAGRCSEARMLSDPEEVEPGFVVTGTYPDYRSVVQGEKDFLALVVKGVFKVKGDMLKIMQNAKFIRAVANSISRIDSEFLGD